VLHGGVVELPVELDERLGHVRRQQAEEVRAEEQQRRRRARAQDLPAD
jgi:hypothetical protein